VRIAAALHVTTETANLVRTLKAGGAQVALSASNPLSTKDDVAAALVARYGIATFARRGEDRDTYYSHLNSVADIDPHMTMDDGCDLVSLFHQERRHQLPGIWGGTEETTTGVIRLKAMAADKALTFPVIAVNEAQTKHLFDNRYGTGQSTVDGILRATNLLLAGRTLVLFGYGATGKGIAQRARGAGATVIVCEVDPLRALEARMDAFEVMPALDAAERGDLFVTVTGSRAVIRREHLERMRDGAVLANAGHFDVEIDVPGLRAMAVSATEVRPGVQQFALADGRRIHLLAEGRLVNLASAEGHPASVMDMSFAAQALSVEFLAREGADLAPAVIPVPRRIDREIAALKLAALGVAIDELTEEQRGYLASWDGGSC
jgi:adenosylhomocysteinase